MMSLARRAILPALLAAPLLAQATFTLPNGLKVVLYEDHSLPLVRGEFRLTLPAPGEDAEAWLRPVGFRMLAAGGSGTRSAAAFALASDAIGLELHPELSATSATWTFAARAQDQEAALALLADRLMRPAFDPIALEPVRLAAWNELAETNALSRSRLRFERSLLGISEPDERALGAVDPLRLAAWHRRLFRPDRGTLALWGDLDLSQARQLAMLTFGAWSVQPEAPPIASTSGSEPGPFLAALPGEAPSVALGLVDDGQDRALRAYLRPWLVAQVKAAGLDLAPGEGLVLQADAALGVSAESLRARLSATLDTLPTAFTARDLAALNTASTANQRLVGLHPGALLAAVIEPSLPPPDFAAAQTALARWCAPANRRLWMRGDPGALQGLQITTPKR